MTVISPEQLRAYTSFKVVKKRPDDLLLQDIYEAEVHINAKLGKPLDEHSPLPKQLGLATLKVAQFFALVNGDEARAKGIKSEKISDYSYTLSDGDELKLPDVAILLGDYAKQEKISAPWRMRPL